MRIVLIMLLVSVSSFSMPSTNSNSKNFETDVKNLLGNESILKLLKLPAKQRFQRVNKKPKIYSQKLRKVSFNTKHHLKLRWRAFTTLIRMDNPNLQKDLNSAFQSRDWFLRDAALRALCEINSTKCQNRARKLVSDPALVVRSTAVKKLIETKDKKSSDILWKQLYSDLNYRSGKSLWIRKYLAQSQVEFSSKLNKDKYWPRFYKMLQDKDENMHAYAVAGLEKLYGEPKRQLPMSMKRKMWLQKFTN